MPLIRIRNYLTTNILKLKRKKTLKIEEIKSSIIIN